MVMNKVIQHHRKGSDLSSFGEMRDKQVILDLGLRSHIVLEGWGR